MSEHTAESGEPNIEALAVALAWESAQDHVYSDSWMGWPDPDDDDQMRESMEGSLPRFREQAQRYVDILFPTAKGASDNDWTAIRAEAARAHRAAWSLNTAEREGWADQQAHNLGMTDAVLAVVARHLGITFPTGETNA